METRKFISEKHLGNLIGLSGEHHFKELEPYKTNANEELKAVIEFMKQYLNPGKLISRFSHHVLPAFFDLEGELVESHALVWQANIDYSHDQKESDIRSGIISFLYRSEKPKFVRLCDGDIVVPEHKLAQAAQSALQEAGIPYTDE